MANYAIVDNQTNQIVNVIVWDGITAIAFDNNCFAVLMPENCVSGIGGSYINGEFTEPPLVISHVEEIIQPQSTGTQTL
jgi:hypothetical protein